MRTQLYKSNTLVILDNGHGINTPGKRSPIWNDGTQLFEWKFNRSIVNSIIEYLNVAEISYVNLVTEDIDISLSDRVSRINELYSKYKKDFKLIYVISVHGNAADGIPKANGIEVFTSKGLTKSDQIAEILFNKLSNLGWRMRADFTDKDSDKEENFYILKNTDCPAVLTENGFYTNEEECKKMLDFYWQKQIALGHYRAIQEIENNSKL